MPSYLGSAMEDSKFARILCTGKPKTGKTLATLRGGYDTYVINCDKKYAQSHAANYGIDITKMRFMDVECFDDWKEACMEAVSLSKEGKINLVVLDTITNLVNNVIAPEMSTKFQGFEIWRNTVDNVLNGINYLFKECQAHLVMNAHYDFKDGVIELDGKLKSVIPSLAFDIVKVDFDGARDPEFAFQIGPSPSGLTGGRHSRHNKTLPADLAVLLKELGYNN